MFADNLLNYFYEGLLKICSLWSLLSAFKLVLCEGLLTTNLHRTNFMKFVNNPSHRTNLKVCWQQTFTNLTYGLTTNLHCNCRKLFYVGMLIKMAATFGWKRTIACIFAALNFYQKLTIPAFVNIELILQVINNPSHRTNLTGWQQTFTNLYRLTTNLHRNNLTSCQQTFTWTNLTGWQQRTNFQQTFIEII